MDYLDEEGEALLRCVSGYDLVDRNDEPISFSVLPLQLHEGDILGDLEVEVFLHGTTNDGLQKVYKQVIAWKFELSFAQPEISVLSKGKYWIMLQRPRKSFRNIISSILITVHWLHLVKKNLEAPGKYIWTQLLKAFRSYEVEPSKSDLFVHMMLIREIAEGDKDFANSKDVQTMKKPEFIVLSGEDENSYGEDPGENGGSYAVCAICDDGGDVLFCDGRCLRAFHATIASGIESSCESLGYTEAQVKAVSTFLCNNCLYQKHQCFACGMIGSSDRSSQQEVFPCVSATCGHFYHPECVANLLHPDDRHLADELKDRINAGESFACPAHKCFVCKQSEDKSVRDLHFAMCRRCPKAYHRKCLPREITFSREKYFQRAWEDLLPYNRILIYCKKHKILSEFQAPARDHLIFPGVEGNRKKEDLELLSSKEKVVAMKRSMVSESFRTVVKKQKLVEACSGVEIRHSHAKIKNECTGEDFGSLKKPKVTDTGRKALKDTAEICKLSLRKDSLLAKSTSNVAGKMKKTILDKPTMKRVKSSQHLIDLDIEKRIQDLITDVSSSVNKDEFMTRLIIPATHERCSKNILGKNVTLGLVEGSVKAVRTALQKLEEGYSIEDAKTVCEQEILYNIFRWKWKLEVYLAPFLHGMRYTSFGRHFTKVEKLEEIADRLHWYVRSGDTIVDFCCGSNDFSYLMKEKLEKMGKSCSFRNFDLFQPKNDFSFEKRDWMNVKPEELPDGSQLIMGLNPPFGVKASLANYFINKALSFKPKLLILIVPKETRRLDEKANYDLIWEDDELLSGKSFYLPGSVDKSDNHMDQWNLKAPPLFLWSRSDWSGRHKKIAEKHGHVSSKNYTWG